MCLGNAKDGGEVLKAPAQKVVRVPVPSTVLQKLTGKMMCTLFYFYFFGFSDGQCPS